MSKIYEFSLFNVDFQIELSDAEGGAPKPFKSRLTLFTALVSKLRG